MPRQPSFSCFSFFQDYWKHVSLLGYAVLAPSQIRVRAISLPDVSSDFYLSLSLSPSPSLNPP